jgi:hypothetical protein
MFNFNVGLLLSHIKIKENFDFVKGNIVLLGDSILDNQLYVSSGKSVVKLIEERNSGETYCYARDGAKIASVFNQIDFIPRGLNASIFLSVGGNDILSHFDRCDECFNNKNIDDFLDSTFTLYKDLVKSIGIRSPNNKIYLLDIYYPDSEQYMRYYPVVTKWNEMLYALAGEKNVVNVIRISDLLTRGDDFSSDIEPSSKGGYKIADGILRAFF